VTDSTELAAYTSHNSTDTVKPSRDDAIIAVRAAEGWMRYSLYWKYFPYGYDGMRQESERDTNGKKWAIVEWYKYTNDKCAKCKS